MALKLTREELDQYRELLERKQALAIEAAALKTELEQFHAKVQSQLLSSEKKAGVRYGWSFALFTGDKSVSWKKEYIALAGKEKAIQLVEAGKGAGKVKLAVVPPQDLAHLLEKAKADSDDE